MTSYSLCRGRCMWVAQILLLAFLLPFPCASPARAGASCSVTSADTSASFGTAVDAQTQSMVSTSFTLTIGCTGLASSQLAEICVAMPTAADLTTGTGAALSMSFYLSDPTQENATPWNSAFALIVSRTTSKAAVTIFAGAAVSGTAASGAYSGSVTPGLTWAAYDKTSAAPACSTVLQSITASTVSISLGIQASCTVATQDLDFGNYSFGANSAVSPISTTFDVICSQDATYSVFIPYNAGLSNRVMTAPDGSTISYTLTKSDGTEWAIPSTGLKGIGQSQSFTVIGTVGTIAGKPAGAYADTVTVTVNY